MTCLAATPMMTVYVLSKKEIILHRHLRGRTWGRLPKETKFHSDDSSFTTSNPVSTAKPNFTFEAELGSGTCLQSSTISQSFSFSRFEEINMLWRMCSPTSEPEQRRQFTQQREHDRKRRAASRQNLSADVTEAHHIAVRVLHVLCHRRRSTHTVHYVCIIACLDGIAQTGSPQHLGNARRDQPVAKNVQLVRLSVHIEPHVT